jgi:hypothetical protein
MKLGPKEPPQGRARVSLWDPVVPTASSSINGVVNSGVSALVDSKSLSAEVGGQASKDGSDSGSVGVGGVVVSSFSYRQPHLPGSHQKAGLKVQRASVVSPRTRVIGAQQDSQFKLKVNPVNVNQELNDLEVRINQQLEAIASFDSAATHRLSDPSSSSSAMLTTVKFADEVIAELLKTTAAHNSKLAMLIHKLWNINKDSYVTLIDKLSFSLKTSQFMVKDKVAECEGLRKQAFRSKIIVSESSQQIEENMNTPACRVVDSDFSDAASPLQQLNIRQQLEAEINTKTEELTNLQSMISRMAVWFPNFDIYGSSILSRMLPPLSSPELIQQQEELERETRDGFLYDDSKGPIKKNLLLAKTKLYFQATKNANKKSSITGTKVAGGNDHERPTGSSKEHVSSKVIADELNDDIDADEFNGLSATETTKISQWYLMKDIRRLEQLGIGLSFNLRLPDTLERHMNPGHTTDGAAAGKRDQYMISMINPSGNTCGSFINTGMSAVNNGGSSSSCSNNTSSARPPLLHRKSGNISNSNLDTPEKCELQLEIANETIAQLSTQLCLLEKRLKQAEDKFQLSILETQLLEVDIENIKKACADEKRTWHSEKEKLSQKIHVLEATNTKLNYVRNMLVRSNLLSTQLFPFLCEAENMVARSLADPSSAHIVASQRPLVRTKDQQQRIEPNTSLNSIPVRSAFTNPLALLRQIMSFALRTGNSGRKQERLPAIQGKFLQTSSCGLLCPFLVNKDLYIRDKGIISSNSGRQNIQRQQDEGAQVDLMSSLSDKPPSGIFADLLQQYFCENYGSSSSASLAKISSNQFFSSVQRQLHHYGIVLLGPLPSITKSCTSFYPPLPPPSLAREGDNLPPQRSADQIDSSDEDDANFCESEVASEHARKYNSCVSVEEERETVYEHLLNVQFGQPSTTGIADVKAAKAAENLNDAAKDAVPEVRGFHSNNDSSTLILTLRILNELFSIVDSDEAVDISFRRDPSVVAVTNTWHGVLRREAFFNVFAKLFNPFKHFIAPSSKDSAEMTHISVTRAVSIVKRVFYVELTSRDVDTAILPENMLIPVLCPWWMLLPQEIFDALKMDLYMAGSVPTGETAKHERFRQSDHGQVNEGLLNPLQVIMLTWNSIVRLEAVLNKLLQDLCVFMIKCLGILEASHPVFRYVLYYILQENAHRTVTLCDAYRRSDDSEHHVDNDEDINVLPPSPLHPQLASELYALDARFAEGRYICSRSGDSAGPAAKWQQDFKCAFATLLLQTRSPLIALSFLNIFGFIFPECSATDPTGGYLSLEERSLLPWSKLCGDGVNMREQLSRLINQLQDPSRPHSDESLDDENPRFHDDTAASGSVFRRHLCINKVVDVDFLLRRDSVAAEVDTHLIDSRPDAQARRATRQSTEKEMVNVCRQVLLATEPLFESRYLGLSPPKKQDILLALKILPAVISLVRQRIQNFPVAGCPGNVLMRTMAPSHEEDIILLGKAAEHRKYSLLSKYFGDWIRSMAS